MYGPKGKRAKFLSKFLIKKSIWTKTEHNNTFSPNSLTKFLIKKSVRTKGEEREISLKVSFVHFYKGLYADFSLSTLLYSFIRVCMYIFHFLPFCRVL